MNTNCTRCLKLSAFCFAFFFSLIAKAGRPLNGNTAFNSVSASMKASGNAGTGTGLTATNIEGFDFKLTTTVSFPNMAIEVWDGAVSTGNGVALYDQTSATNPKFSAITITANDGSRFDLNSIGINGQSSGSSDAIVTITGLNKSGVPVSGATVSGTASVVSLTAFSVSGNAAFKAIYGIRITSADLVYAFIDNINLSNVIALPLTWTNFSAAKKDGGIQLAWSTAFEQGTRDFTVQHSADGNSWTTIGTLAAAGSSAVGKAYGYFHSSPINGENYYRIVQRDLDGAESFSKVISVNLAEKSILLSLFPNPVRNSGLNINLEKAATVQIFNSSGITVLKKELSSGLQVLHLPALPAGIYYLRAGERTVSFSMQ